MNHHLFLASSSKHRIFAFTSVLLRCNWFCNIVCSHFRLLIFSCAHIFVCLHFRHFSSTIGSATSSACAVQSISENGCRLPFPGFLRSLGNLGTLEETTPHYNFEKRASEALPCPVSNFIPVAFLHRLLCLSILSAFF